MGNSCGCVSKGVSHAMEQFLVYMGVTYDSSTAPCHNLRARRRAHFSLSIAVFPQTCARPTLRSFDCDPLPFAVVPPSDAVTGAEAACAGGWVDEMDELRV